MNQRELLISEKKRQRDDIFSNGGAKIAVMRENARWYESQWDFQIRPSNDRVVAGIIFSTCLLYLRFMAESQNCIPHLEALLFPDEIIAAQCALAKGTNMFDVTSLPKYRTSWNRTWHSRWF